MMAFGCLGSVAVYLIALMLLVPDTAPLLAVVLFLIATILIVNRWLRSEWPLY